MEQGMGLRKEIYHKYCEILKQELVLAMGCTEPIAISYAAAIARDTLGRVPTHVKLSLSGNIMKNVKSVIVPGTGGLRGMKAAIAAGIVAGCPERKLEVLSKLSKEDRSRIGQLLKECNIQVNTLESGHIFDIQLTASSEHDVVKVRIVDLHTNVVFLQKNETTLLELPVLEPAKESQMDLGVLTVEDIVTFADTVDLSKLETILRQQVSNNMAIAEEGLKHSYGSNIGQILMQSGLTDVRIRARAMAAAASDARMNGCEMPVGIVSGSGNQGITASVPVVVYAKTLNVSEEKLLRALIVSNLITIHQKTGIGRLSAYCGVVSAGCGCGAGIAYLYGGGYKEVAHTIVNAVAILSGTICDGAKSSCAAKISMAVESGILGFEMYQNGKQFYDGDGIVKKGVENTIANVGRLARIGMRETDREIMKIMIEDNET